MSADPKYTLVLDTGGVAGGPGIVVSVAVGGPADVHVDPGFEGVERSGAAADAWVGWARTAAGAWIDPNAPGPVTKDALAAYAAARRYELEVSFSEDGCTERQKPTAL